MTIVTGFTGGDYAYQMANATVFFLIDLVISSSSSGPPAEGAPRCPPNLLS